MTFANRRRDWPARLIAYIASVRRTPFAAGSHDCAQFTGGAVEAMTGVNPAKAWAGKYTTIRGGVRAVRKAGHADHVAIVASLYPEVPPALAHPGDIGVIANPDGGMALGVVQGEGVYVVTERGLGVVSRMKMVRAFRV